MTYTSSYLDFLDALAVAHQDAPELNGRIFIDTLHKFGRHTLANSFTFAKNDPLTSGIVNPEDLTFVERNWNFKG